MKEIKFLMGLTAESRLIAGMMFVIVFLASGWGLCGLNYSQYRDRKEKQISDMEREHAKETISFYNRLIEGQTRRDDKLDSVISKVEQTIKNSEK